MTKEMYTPPQIKTVEFGEDDVVVCSDGTTDTKIPLEGEGETDEQW